MATFEDSDYLPCEKCGDDMSETLNQGGKVLCEACHNATSCGCETCLKEAPLEVGKKEVQ